MHYRCGLCALRHNFGQRTVNAININVFQQVQCIEPNGRCSTGTLIRQKVQLLKILNPSQKCRTRCDQIDRMRRRMSDHLYEQGFRPIESGIYIEIRITYVYISQAISITTTILQLITATIRIMRIFLLTPLAGQYNQLYKTCAIQHFESYQVLNSD